MRTPRQTLVLAALFAGKGTSDLTPVQAQKLFFLVDREAAQLCEGPHFNFEPYDYGPFDRAVYGELDLLSMTGDVEVDWSGQHRVYRLTEAGLQNAQAAFLSLGAEAQDYLARAKDWVKSLSFRDLVSAIYAAYPETKAKSIFDDGRNRILFSGRVVIGADSMLTPSMGNIAVGHHKGKGARFDRATFRLCRARPGRTFSDHARTRGHGRTGHCAHPHALTQSLIQQFHNTGIGNAINLNCFLGFNRLGRTDLCVFEGMLQPRLMDAMHFYAALGSGKLSADPFLRFLVDIFCVNGPPTVSEAVLLTTWAIQHVIDTNPGGVAGPIKIGVMEANRAIGNVQLLSDNEIDDHRQAVKSATDALRLSRGFANGVTNIALPPHVQPPPTA
jgi:hypothetical protein